MGAGDMLAGDGLAGDDSLLAPVEIPHVRPAAIFFDGATRDWPLDADGHYIGIHPVDAAMQMAVMVGVGTLPASTTTGNTLPSNEYLDPRTIDAKVKDAIRIATKRLVDRGDVTIDSVTPEIRGGSLFVEVAYFNERLPDRARKTVTTTR